MEYKFNKTKQEMQHAFDHPFYMSVEYLAQWDYKDLEYLKSDYDAILQYRWSSYFQERFDKVNQAITAKRVEEREIWTSLGFVIS